MTNKMENINDVTMEKNYTVYMHVCPNGKRYIGITRQKPERRWQNGNGYKHNEYFWRAIQKYEWNNFEHIIIENNLTVHDANQMEIELIAKFKSNDRKYGYNIESGGNAIGKTSKETIEKLRELNRGRGCNKGGNNHNAKKVYCNGIIFECVTYCANYYGLNKNTMYSWLKGQNNMPVNFQKLNLRYATNDDINKCEKYDIGKHENKASIVIKVTENSKNVHCDNLIFKSIVDCANYYGLNKNTMYSWLRGQNKMPLGFQKLNLRYATNDDLDTYPRYTPTNN